MFVYIALLVLVFLFFINKERANESYVHSRETGTVKWFNPIKGFGFIERENGRELFVHHSEVKRGGYRTLYKGEKVQFDAAQGWRGPMATNVEVV